MSFLFFYFWPALSPFLSPRVSGLPLRSLPPSDPPSAQETSFGQIIGVTRNSNGSHPDSLECTEGKHAEESLKQFQEQNLPAFLLSLSNELANNEKPVDSRKLAGLILKSALDAKEQHRKNELVQRWLSLDVAVKAQIKAWLLQTLPSPAPDARSTASQVIAKIAGIELPQKQWPELIGSLLSSIHQHQHHVKQATLETLGYMCTALYIASVISSIKRMS